MATFDRAAHCRRIAALGGKRTVELHGTAHMASIGKRGFAVALALGWGPELAKKLGASYEARFHRPIVLGEQAAAKARIRREARRIFGGNPCDHCGACERTEVHHVHGVEAGNVEANIYVLCAACHRRLHQEARRARRIARRKTS